MTTFKKLKTEYSQKNSLFGKNGNCLNSWQEEQLRFKSIDILLEQITLSLNN